MPANPAIVEARRLLPQLYAAKTRCQREGERHTERVRRAVVEAISNGRDLPPETPEHDPLVYRYAAERTAGASIGIMAVLDALDGAPEALHKLLTNLGVPPDA